MPKQTDQASKRAPREPGTAHIRLLLSGDLKSPQQVMASQTLSRGKKREIFEVWLRDLQSRPQAEAQSLLDEIHRAIAMLDREERPKRA